MDLVTAPLNRSSLAECAGLLAGRLAYPDPLVRDLVPIWDKLLVDEAMRGCVVRASSDRGPSGVMGFAAGVFIDADWFAATERGHEPYVSARTLAHEMTGGPSPILRPKAITQANDSDALHVLSLHYCEAPGLADDVTMQLRYQMLSTFVEIFRTYRIRAVLQEFWDEIDHAFIVNGWGLVRSDYAAYYAQRGQAVPPPGQRPYLIGVTRDEARAQPGNPLAPVFVHTPPTLRFSPAEKELLRQAMTGMTDQELALALGVAPPTVKTRWRAIYRRVADIVPDLLPGDEPDGDGIRNRGQEKRRHLMNYLRRHPEELRSGIDERRSQG